MSEASTPSTAATPVRVLIVPFGSAKDIEVEADFHGRMTLDEVYDAVAAHAKLDRAAAGSSSGWHLALQPWGRDTKHALL
ncbi:MAG: hypothetical protein MHM6MM_009324, partial [Cercozoa sp. M6MM]